MADLTGILADLTAEGATVDDMVAPLPADAWSTPTPAPGWTIAHQIAHLAWTDEVAIQATTDVETFRATVAAAAADAAGYADTAARAGAAEAPDTLLERWRAGRQRLVEVLAAVPDGVKLPWFGPPMSPMSMVTARIMETWAHGVDVSDALGLPIAVTDRLRHVAHIGVRTRDFAYLIRDLTPPSEPFRVELTGPFGDLWAWGPADAAQQVAGRARDFCLLVTQRRHRSDLALTAIGPDADAWLDIAQAFAGPPGSGREPGGPR